MAEKQSSLRPVDVQSLRRQAENLLQTTVSEMPTLPTSDVRALVHELCVFQMDLEIQNEELRQAQVELAETRDRFADLYDFAPVGYLTLDKNGTILAANLTAAAMLGLERESLLGNSLNSFVTPQSHDDCFLHQQDVFARESRHACDLEMQKADGTPMIIHLESIAFGTNRDRRCRTAMVDMTITSQTQRQLSENEERLRQLNETLEQRVADQTRENQLLAEAISHLGEGVAITSDGLVWPAPRIVFVNEAMCRITGYTADELIGQTPRILQGADTDRGTLNRIKSELSAGRCCAAELINYRKDGTPYNAELFITPLQNAQGHHTNFVSVHRDITQRQRSEQELRASEELTRAILASLAAHIAVIDRTGSILVVNPTWEVFAQENAGVAARCSVGADYLQVCKTASDMGADKALQMLAGLTAILEGAEDELKIEYPCHSPTEQRWFLLQATPLRYGAGGAVISHTNITNRVLAEQALRDEHVLSENIINTAHAIVLVLDTDGRIVRFNPFLERLSGWRLDEVKGQDWFETFLREEDRSPLRDLFQRAIRGTPTHGNINVVMTKDGREREIEWYDAPMTNGENECIGLLCTGQDMTERRLLEREVLEISAGEQRRIGHDLHDGVCQELTGLGMFAQGLADMLAAEDATKSLENAGLLHLRELARQLSEGIGNATKHARDLSHGLIPVDVDSQGLVAALRELVALIDKVHDVRCTFEPAAPVELFDNFTATHLYRIAQEAVGNALKHSQAKQIRIALEQYDDQVVLRVTDDGLGMRVDTEDSQGMGLRIMKYRADLIGAALNIRARPSQGTVVECRYAKRHSAEPV